MKQKYAARRSASLAATATCARSPRGRGTATGTARPGEREGGGGISKSGWKEGEEAEGTGFAGVWYVDLWTKAVGGGDSLD
jgi:hypothetical protein